MPAKHSLSSLPIPFPALFLVTLQILLPTHPLGQRVRAHRKQQPANWPAGITFCSFIRHYVLLFHYFLLVSNGIFRQRSAQLCSKHTTKDSPQSSRPSDEQSHCNSLCRRTTSQQPIRTHYITVVYADALHCSRLASLPSIPPPRWQRAAHGASHRGAGYHARADARAERARRRGAAPGI
jgi:hypothetical protein